MNEKDKQIRHRLKKYYEMRRGRSKDSIGFNSYYERLKRDFVSHLSEHFLDSNVESFIIDNLPTYSTNNPIIAVDISVDFGKYQQELIIVIRKMFDNEAKEHDRSQPESDRLVFDSKDDAESFVTAIKLNFDGQTDTDYNIIINNELEDDE